MRIRSLMPMLGVIGVMVLVAPLAATALPIAGSSFGENQTAFVAQVTHPDVTAAGSGGTPDHILVPAGGSLFWDLKITIDEVDGGGLVADTVSVMIESRHKVGIPTHPGEVGNPTGVVMNLFTLGGPFVIGVNSVEILPADPPNPVHPPLGHVDQFGAKLTWTSGDGLSITSFTVDVSGTHCDTSCPVLPDADSSLIPEPSTGLLLVSWIGFLAVRRRRRPTRPRSAVGSIGATGIRF